MKNILLYFIFLFFMGGVFSKTVSVKEGDSVTLFPELTEIKKDEVIDWRFGDVLIARVRNNNNLSVYEDALDGKFRGRLTLNGQTGDLTITNFRTTDAGEYEVSNSINTIKKTFSVVLHSGLSPGEIAGIVVGVLVALVAAAVGGVIYKKKSQVI
ncbi:hypothetical protein G5714_021286 [Onychostoma macrolepis]|uniref:Immunoglobulin subtype domain-containing protein n=1 Tax=Onychostoma macrolepis TaxID=369639 RepID=A0A7J6BQH9_9TELE|nr:hypothetical protein G5714_021286 [Onychostoma macrolepis]